MVSLMGLGMLCCKSPRKQVRNTPCKTIAQRAGQCRKQVLQLMKERKLAEKRKHKAAWARIELKKLSSEADCKKKVASTLKYLDRDCSMYVNRRPCEGAKAGHIRRMKALTRCFTQTDCRQVAVCFLDEYARF